MVFENPSITLPLVRAGKVRALATTGAARMGETPDVPTMVESGLAGFVAVSFTGIAAPAKTPPAIVKKLNAAANQALNSPDVKATLTRLAVEEHLGSAEDFAKFLAQQRDYWGRAIEAAQIKTK